MTIPVYDSVAAGLKISHEVLQAAGSLAGKQYITSELPPARGSGDKDN
jgi:hypothetical protein